MDFDSIEILLIEDNPSDVELTLNALSENHVTNRVRVLKDGAEALQYIFDAAADPPRSCPKVILLDLKLPKVGGLEVLRRIKADERTRYIPVVVLTSSNEERDRMECYRLGVNSYIVKPVEFDAFARSVVEIGYYWTVLNKPFYSP